MLETRRSLIQRIQRLVYGEFPQNDSNITENLVNRYINDAIAVAAKNSYLENIKVDGIEYVNNSFYTTFTNIDIGQSEANLYMFSLPQIPLAIGRDEGLVSVVFKDDENNVSYDAIPLNINQLGYHRSMRVIPNKVLYWYENSKCYVLTSLPLNLFKAKIRMISGSNSDYLDSVLNVPQDWIGGIIEYVSKYLIIERNQPQDMINDGRDLAKK